MAMKLHFTRKEYNYNYECQLYHYELNAETSLRNVSCLQSQVVAKHELQSVTLCQK
jgi:hypothetical protein